MYAKLAFRNVKRSAKDYLIYLLTLVISVSLFYGFLSITSPSYNSRLPIRMDLEYFSGKMRIIIPLIAFLLTFLVSYVNRYIMKHRKKEFALQIIMGMEQRTVAYLFFIEMFFIGLIAVILGILLGTLTSQVVSAIIMATFEEDYRFFFSIFTDTVLWTFLFFMALFIVIGFGNIYVLRKQKLVEMLYDGHKTESGATVKDMLLGPLLFTSLLAVCILLMIVRGIMPFWSKTGYGAKLPTIVCTLSVLVFLTFAVAFIVRICYIKKSGSSIAFILFAVSTSSGASLLLISGLFEDLLKAGLITGAVYSFGPPILAAGMIIFGLVAFFSCFSWALFQIKKKSAGFRYKHLFLLGQIISKMNTNSKTMAILTCVLMGAMVLLGWLPVFTGQVNGYLKARATYDVSVVTGYPQMRKLDELPKDVIDGAYVDKYLEDGGYKVTGSANMRIYFLKDSDFDIYLVPDMPVLAVPLSDFNALLKLCGRNEISLPDGRFAVAWENTTLRDEIEKFGKEHPSIRVGERILDKVPAADYKMDTGTGLFRNKKNAVYILPDEVCAPLTLAAAGYHANTAQPIAYGFAERMTGEISKWLHSVGLVSESAEGINFKTMSMNEGNSNLLMLRLGGSYTSLILIVICLTVLALQQLTDSAEHRKRFDIIRMLGADRDETLKYVRQQMSIWFGLPVLLAFIGAGVILAYLACANYRYYIPFMTETQVIADFLSVYGVTAVVLISYFLTAYILIKRNLGMDLE